MHLDVEITGKKRKLSSSNTKKPATKHVKKSAPSSDEGNEPGLIQISVLLISCQSFNVFHKQTLL